MQRVWPRTYWSEVDTQFRHLFASRELAVLSRTAKRPQSSAAQRAVPWMLGIVLILDQSPSFKTTVRRTCDGSTAMSSCGTPGSRRSI